MENENYWSCTVVDIFEWQAGPFQRAVCQPNCCPAIYLHEYLHSSRLIYLTELFQQQHSNLQFVAAKVNKITYRLPPSHLFFFAVLSSQAPNPRAFSPTAVISSISFFCVICQYFERETVIVSSHLQFKMVTHHLLHSGWTKIAGRVTCISAFWKSFKNIPKLTSDYQTYSKSCPTSGAHTSRTK